MVDNIMNLSDLAERMLKRRCGEADGQIAGVSVSADLAGSAADDHNETRHFVCDFSIRAFI